MPRESRRDHHRSHDDHRRRSSRRDLEDRHDKRRRHESHRRSEGSRHHTDRSRSPYTSRRHKKERRSRSPVRRDEEFHKEKRIKKDRGHKSEDAAQKKADFSADITPEDLQIMQSMGIPFGFTTTQGKQVDDEEANASAIRTKSLRQARQYMNRKGGFNRPLPAEKTGQKVIRD
eukprot:g3399.t1